MYTSMNGATGLGRSNGDIHVGVGVYMYIYTYIIYIYMHYTYIYIYIYIKLGVLLIGTPKIGCLSSQQLWKRTEGCPEGN